MSDLISKKALVKAILAERDKHPLEVEERYSFGVKVPCKFNQAFRGGIRRCLHLIETAPTVDAVEVVRCKDCKHRKSVWHKDGRMKDGGYYYCYCELDTGDPFELGREAEEDDWFCADGERKEVTHEET